MRPTGRVLLIGGLLLALAASAAAALTPAQLYASSLTAAHAQRAVHYVAESRLAGNHETIVGDAARDRGSQRITFQRGGTTGHVTVIVVANTAYVRGDAFTLQNYLGLTAAQASSLSGRWFFLKPPSGGYQVVAEAVRIDSLIGELTMPGPYTAVAPTTVGKQRVTGVRSSVTRSGQVATVTLYASAAGRPLPVRQVAQGSTGVITTTFSAWNERVVVAQPRGAVAFH